MSGLFFLPFLFFLVLTAASNWDGVRENDISRVPHNVLSKLHSRLLSQQVAHDSPADPPFRFAQTAGLFASDVHFNALAKEALLDDAATLVRRKFKIVTC